MPRSPGQQLPSDSPTPRLSNEKTARPSCTNRPGTSPRTAAWPHPRRAPRRGPGAGRHPSGDTRCRGSSRPCRCTGRGSRGDRRGRRASPNVDGGASQRALSGSETPLPHPLSRRSAREHRRTATHLAAEDTSSQLQRPPFVTRPRPDPRPALASAAVDLASKCAQACSKHVPRRRGALTVLGIGWYLVEHGIWPSAVAHLPAAPRDDRVLRVGAA